MSAQVPLLPDVPDAPGFEAARGDPTVWLEACEVICGRHDLDAAALYAEPTGTNVVFRAGDGPWIKLFPPLWSEDCTRERVGLEAAAAVTNLALPRVLAAGEIEGWPYLVLTHLEGRPLGEIWLELEDAQRVPIARQLGALLARLHATDVDALTVLSCDWPQWVQEQRTVCVERQRGYGLDESWARALEAYVAALPDLVDPTDAPVLLHADVTDDHVFVEPDGDDWRVTGLLDFGDAMVGDRLYDFAAPLVFLTQRRPRAQRALLEGYGWNPADVDPVVVQRLVGWCLLHRWGQIPSYLRFTPGRRPRTLAEFIEALWSQGPFPVRPDGAEPGRTPA